MCIPTAWVMPASFAPLLPYTAQIAAPASCKDDKSAPLDLLGADHVLAKLAWALDHYNFNGKLRGKHSTWVAIPNP